MQSDRPEDRTSSFAKAFLSVAFGLLLLVVAWISFSIYNKSTIDDELDRSNLDRITDVIREKSNRSEVFWISGKVTTVRETDGGPFGIFDGKLVIRQPFRVGYFLDMRRMTLSDYIWNEKSKTLFVRLPPVRPDPPNIDSSKQETQADGWVITRDMQNRLRASIANGAKRQAEVEALSPGNMALAQEGAREAIMENLIAPLKQAGVQDVRVEVLGPKGSTERWDVSRSIAEVLAEQAAR